MHMRGYGSSEGEVNILLLYLLVGLVALILWVTALTDKLRTGLRVVATRGKRLVGRFDTRDT